MHLPLTFSTVLLPLQGLLLLLLGYGCRSFPAVASPFPHSRLAQIPAIEPQELDPDSSFPFEIQEPQPGLVPAPPDFEFFPNINIPNSFGSESIITVTQFKFTENTAFSTDELAANIRVTCSNNGESRQLREINEDNPCLLSLSELVQVAGSVAGFYAEFGYETSGAEIVIPEDTQENQQGTIVIEVIEGELEEIRIVPLVSEEGEPGSLRLNPNYVRSRLQLATSKPLNINRLQEALQLLQLAPPIQRVSASLGDGTASGQSILVVGIEEAPTFSTQLVFDNSRSPSVGSFRRGLEVREDNLLGLGDSISFNYANTDGSNVWDWRYTVPIGPRNGTLSFNYSWTDNKVIEPVFERLDITSYSRSYAVTLRQPLIQTIQNRTTFQELAIGLTGSVRESQSFLLGIPFPFSASASVDGYTKIAALRFFQEWTLQSPEQVLAFRSQLNWGWDAFDATINEAIAPSNEFIPDSRFFAWQAQGQWVRLLGPDTLFILRGNLQLADRPLVPVEQFSLGGFGSVRAYRQDFLLADNGLFASAELRIPILRVSEGEGVLQVIPFVDYGVGWNLSGRLAPDLNPNTIAAAGLGLQWQQGDWLTARLEWGIPLIQTDLRKKTWQENGIYFNVRIGLF